MTDCKRTNVGVRSSNYVGLAEIDKLRSQGCKDAHGFGREGHQNDRQENRKLWGVRKRHSADGIALLTGFVGISRHLESPVTVRETGRRKNRCHLLWSAHWSYNQ